jgi:hypothetical protein
VFDFSVSMSAGEVSVRTVDNRGFSVEEVADMAVNKILFVAEDAPAPIRDQARDFKEVMRQVIVQHLKVAVDHDRATICAKLRGAGYPELADNLRSL